MDRKWIDLQNKIFYRLFVSSCYADLSENTYILIGGEDESQNNQFGSLKYDEMIGEYADTMIHPLDRELVKLHCSRAYLMGRLINDKLFFFDFRLMVEGTYRWHRMHVVVDDYDIKGEPQHVLLSIMYIDDVKQNELVYQEKLKEANRAKSDFLSNISHDLRTPMNAIMGFMTLIEEDADNPRKVRDDVNKMRASGRHLLSIINDVLDMNKIESGVMAINNVEFELSSFLSDINVVMSQLTREKTQNFFMQLKNVTINRIVGDKARMSQILINILSNSIKYTDESGDIILNIRQIPMENKCHLQFEIVDNGIGMEPEFLTRIFEPFAREEGRIPNDVTGTGLGMAITKNLVDLMGGEIHVESKPGTGTTFTVDMFFDVVKDESRFKANIDRSNELKTRVPEIKNLEGKKFLVAEDNAVNGEIISRLLELEGASSVVCPNGKAAVDSFLEHPDNYFDMILMDIRMPIMDGYEATKLIRDNERIDAKSIPIISMTANAFSEDVELAMVAGMNAHVSKPIDFEILKATIKENLKNN